MMIATTKITIQADVLSILIISTLILLFIFVVNRKVKHANPLQKPKGIVSLSMMMVEAMTKFTKENMNHYTSQNYAPYVTVLAIYLLLSNISGLFGISQPTKNFSVTFTLALVTFILIQRATIKTVGIKGFIKSFFEPHPLFFIMNFFGKIAPVISMSVRLFGNITSGSIIMLLLYGFTYYLSSFVPFLGHINFIGPLIAPFFHFYFDLFIGAIQMFIFISLTTVFIGNELTSN